MKVNIGKNTLGDNNKLSVSLKEYGRSTHNLSSAWRSPMGVGTLVPFMKLLGLPGDTFEIDLDTQIMKSVHNYYTVRKGDKLEKIMQGAKKECLDAITNLIRTVLTLCQGRY